MAEQPGEPPDTEVRVERLRTDRAKEAGAVLSASHADYPGFRHVLPDPQRRRRVLRSFLAVSAHDAAAYGYGLLARDEAGALGVALWMPPGTFPLSPARKVRMTPKLLGALLAAGSARGSFLRLGAALEGAHPDGPAWYLQAMGVHPRARRRGVGGRLVSRGLALADEAGLPCYLQTSDSANIAYYERFGFTVTQPAIATYPGGPSYIGMVREAGG